MKISNLFSLSSILYYLWPKVFGKVQNAYHDKGLTRFIEHEMDPSFEWEKYLHQENPYFKKYDIHVPMVETEYCCRSTGVSSLRYMPHSVTFQFLYPYLNRTLFFPAYSDKTLQSRLLGFPDIQNRVDIRFPESYIWRTNGIYYQSSGIILDSPITAAKLLMGKDFIIKPSLGSSGGAGVKKSIVCECAL